MSNIDRAKRSIERQITSERLTHALYLAIRGYVASRDGKRCDARDKIKIAEHVDSCLAEIPAEDAAMVAERVRRVANDWGHGKPITSARWDNRGLDTRVEVRLAGRETTTVKHGRETTSHETPEIALSLHAGPPGQNARFSLVWYDENNEHARGCPARIAELTASIDKVEHAVGVLEQACNALQGAVFAMEKLGEGGRHVGAVYKEEIRKVASEIPGVYLHG